jgi:hypothetical protein
MSAAVVPLESGKRAAPSAAAEAILRTVTYASLFQAPLTLDRLHRNLMDVALSREEMEDALRDPWLRRRIEVVRGLVIPRGRREWIEERVTRRAHSRRLVARHRRVLRWLGRLPYVRMVAISGACAHENATDDDVDVFLVSSVGRAWGVCLVLTVLSRLVGVRRTLCLNYIVDEAALALPEHDVFTAAEVVGLRLLSGPETYRRLVGVNAWAAGLFPNFRARHLAESEGAPPAGARGWERVLDLGPAQLLERLARRVLGRRLERKGRGCEGVVLGPHRLKLHTRDHRPSLLASFERALDGPEWEA